MKRIVVGTGLCFVALASEAAGQARSFVVVLGSDTMAIERFERAGNRIEGTIVRRVPQTNLLRYTIQLNADGSVASYEQRTLRPDGTPAPNAPAVPLRMTFTGDSVIREVMRGSEAVTLRAAAPRNTYPSIGGSFLGAELFIQAAKRGPVHMIGLSPQQAAPAPVTVRHISADSAELVAGGFRTGFRLDASGNVVRADGSLTTQKVMVTSVGAIDVGAVATAWAARDAAGGGMGTLSTRDTVTAVIGGANVWIDYGRPAKRGRAIWGALVPFDTTWRLGANAATQFRTDKDLEIGGVTVPAGTYTLFLYPSTQQSYLIVNTQTGQWGTVHDASKDLARIPVQARMSLPTMEERFRIYVKGDELLMHWDRGGYGVKLRAK